MVFPPNVPHEFVAVEDSVFLDIQTPARQDFLAPDFIEKLRKILSVK
jgi:quercetin dioxygenase-like cupin family protein